MKYNRQELGYRQSVVGYLLDSEDNLLLVHKIPHTPDDWAIPGGGVEDGETEKEALSRELEEELGLKSIDYEILYKSKYPHRYNWSDEDIDNYFKRKGRTFLGQNLEQFILKLNCLKDKIKLQEDELDKLVWVPLKDVFSYIRKSDAQEMLKKVINEYTNYKSALD